MACCHDKILLYFTEALHKARHKRCYASAFPAYFKKFTLDISQTHGFSLLWPLE